MHKKVEKLDRDCHKFLALLGLMPQHTGKRVRLCTYSTCTLEPVFYDAELDNKTRMWWYTLRDVCVKSNGDEHIHFVSSSSEFKEQAQWLLDNITMPYRLTEVESHVLFSNEVLKLTGDSILLQCWRNFEPQPAHVMF